MTHPTAETSAGMHPAELDVVDDVMHPIPVEIVNTPEYKQSISQSHFSTETLQLAAGQITFIPPNPYRKRLVLWVDAANTQPVYLSVKEAYLQGVAPFPKAVLIAAGSQDREFTHVSQICLTCSAAAIVYFFEERYTRS